jgi:3-oxoacyl-[acyl-carrier-protein] synthase-3
MKVEKEADQRPSHHVHSKISAAGHYLPRRRLTNQDLEQLVETSNEWIKTRTGIEERRILDAGFGTSYMAAKAAEEALKQRGLRPQELDLIIVATVTPDMMVPQTAAFVQKKLKAINCSGFDLNGGCAGFICALATGSQFIQSGRYEKVLVIGADTMSTIIDYQDRNTCIIFGDGAGACCLRRPEKKRRAFWTLICT